MNYDVIGQAKNFYGHWRFQRMSVLITILAKTNMYSTRLRGKAIDNCQ
jgi:hypothetical protein